MLPSEIPADLAFEPDLAEKFDAGVRSGLLRALHAVLVVRSGKICSPALL